MLEAECESISLEGGSAVGLGLVGVESRIDR